MSLQSLTDSQWEQYRKWLTYLQPLPGAERAAALEALGAEGAVDPRVLSFLAWGLRRPLDPDRCRTGEQIDNFTLDNEIGSGGMGVVYRARDTTLNRIVALKLIHPALVLTGQSDAVERFKSEMQLLAQFEHANIARIYVGTIHVNPDTKEQLPYFAMQLVEDGVPLTIYAKKHALTMPARLDLFLAVCEAMKALHLKNVIHRDLKPTNILVNPDGHPFVIDFGLARVCDPSRQRDMERVSGTPAYMSPEQVSDTFGPVTLRSDVYTLGVILYELLADRHPYDIPHNASGEAFRQAILTADPIPLSHYDTQCHDALERIVAKALAKKSAKRYPSVAALQQEIRNHRDLLREIAVRIAGERELQRHRAAAVNDAEASPKARPRMRPLPPGGSPPIVGRASVLTALRAALTTGPAPARPGDIAADSSGIVAPCRRPRKLSGQHRRLQRELLAKATSLGQRLDAGSYPLLVSIEREGECALLADARQLLRHATAPGRVALLGEVGSGQREVARLLMQTLADAAQAVAQRRPHFAEHLADLLPAVVSVERWSPGESLIAQLPEELQQLRTRKPETVERCWLVILSDHLSEDETVIQQLLEHLSNEQVFVHCLLVLHSSARRLLPNGWDLVILGGLHVERLPDAVWRRQLRQWMAWTAADHLPVSLATDLKNRPAPRPAEFALALVRYYMQQHATTEVAERQAPFVAGCMLPVVLAHAYQNGTFTLDTGALGALYRNDPSIFPGLVSPQAAYALLAQLSFLFRPHGASLVVVPSCLAAELIATGLIHTHLTPRHDEDPCPFELSVRACWAHASGERAPANVPHLVSLVHTSSQAPDSTELLTSVRELDAAIGQRLMHSHLAESLAELLRPIINAPEVGRLLRSMHSATRALWAFEELTTSRTLDPSIVGILLELIEPDYLDALFALAPGRQRLFIETVSLCPDCHLLERSLGPLARAHPDLLPAAVIDRLSRPRVLGGLLDER